MGSLEDRARAKVASDRAAAEELVRREQQKTHEAEQRRAQRLAEQARLEDPLRVHSTAVLTEFLQLVKKYHISPFELRRAQAHQRKRWGDKYIQTRMTYEFIDMAWQLTPAMHELNPRRAAVAVTARGAMFEFLACRDHMGRKKPRTLYLINNRCAKAFQRGDWWDGARIDNFLGADSELPTTAWEIDPLRGPGYYSSPSPWPLTDDPFPVTLAGKEQPPTREPAHECKTWAELAADSAAVTVLSGRYELPSAEGQGDSKRRSEDLRVVWR